MHYYRKTRSIRSRLLVMSVAAVFLFSSFTACDDSEDSGSDQKGTINGSFGPVDYERLYVISALHFAVADGVGEIGFLEQALGWDPLDLVTTRNRNSYYSVVAYRLTYDSVDPDGNDVRASALLMVPHDFSIDLEGILEDPTNISDADILEAAQNRPLLSLQHGTIFANQNAPSQVDFSLENGSFTEGIIEAGNGFYTIVPDGIGFGPTQETHVRPYVYGPAYGPDTVAAMRAARVFAENQDINLNSKIFLKGYSEGGYATIAVQQYIETDDDLYSEFTLTAVSAGAGPYDIVDTGRKSFTNTSNGGGEEEMNYPAYFPFVGNAYRAWAGVDSFTDRDLDTIFNNDAPTNYADNIPGWYENAELTGDEIDAEITGVISEFMNTDFVTGFLDESGSSTEQDVLDMFAAESFISVETGESIITEVKTPTQIAHCNDDTTIHVAGAEELVDHLKTIAADPEDIRNATTEDNNTGGETSDPHTAHTTCQWLVKPINYFNGF